MAPFPEVEQLHTDIVEKRLPRPPARGFSLALLLAVVPGVAFGQDTLALSSGSGVQGGAVTLNLSLSSPAGSAPAGVQWTLTYAAGNIATISAVASPSATAAGKTIACLSSPVSYSCLLSGTTDAAIGNGVVAVINLTMTGSAVTTPVGLANLAGASAAGSPISITGTGGTITLPAPPAPLPALTGLSCSPTSLSIGGSSTCTATLNVPAPSGGATVALSSSTSALTVPASVTVASGASSASFTAIAGTIPASQTAVVTASLNGGSQREFVALVSTTAASATSVSLLSCSPTSLNSGWVTNCIVTLSQAAGSAGVTVALSSSTTSLNVPASVTVAPGATSAAFIAYAGTITSDLTAVVTASYNGSSQTTSVSLLAPGSVSYVSCLPPTLTSGGTAACSVGLSSVVGPGGAAVTLSSDSAALTVPSSVTVASGFVGSFAATAATVTSNQTAVVTASYNGSSRTTTVIVSPSPSLTAVSCTPAVLGSGGISTCTVTLSSAAGYGGATVTLSSNSTLLTIPGSVTVVAGATVASFTAGAGVVSGQQTAIVTASLNGASETASVSLQPASSQGGAWIACNPDQNNVGGLDCTVSLSQVAPANGVTVFLQTNTQNVQLPLQAQVPAGAQSVQFVAYVASSDQDSQVQITATVQGANLTATIPVSGIRPTSLTCAPQTVQAGSVFTCTVGMNSPNILQVARLTVSSDSTDLELPGAFSTRAGQTALGFEVFTKPLAGQQSSAISVQFGQTVATTTVTVTPAGAPVLNLPGTQFAAFGKPLSFVFSAVDPSGLTLTLAAANLPPGASFDESSGEFLWTPRLPSRRVYPADKPSPLERREVTFTATNNNRISATGSVVIEVDSGLPVITGLRNAGSQQAPTFSPKVATPDQPASMSCSPGSVASLLGRWLGTGTQPTSNPSGSSTLLAGSQVIVNGSPAPLVYVSQTRIDFVCPAAAAPAGELEISAQFGGAVSKVVHADQGATFGLFSSDGSGQGQGMVVFSNNFLPVAPRSYLSNGHPAQPGDAISILATGIGLETSPALIEVSIGGVSVTPNRVQPNSSMAGIYQIEVTVPASVLPGDAIPVVVQIPDADGKTFTSNTVTIAVEAP